MPIGIAWATQPKTELCETRVPNRRRVLFSYAIFFLSGIAGLMYEMSWSRQIGMLFGHTVQVSAIVLAAYFAGMAIGSLVGARQAHQSNPLAVYAVAELIVAIWAVAIPIVLDWSQSADASAWLGDSRPAWQMTVRCLFSFALLLPATVSLGVTLPLMSQYLTQGWNSTNTAHASGSRIAVAYAMNTAGALVGVVAATFVLLVVVGVRSTSYVAAAISIACAGASWILSRRRTDVSYTSPVGENALHAESRVVRPISSVVLAALSGLGMLGLEVLYIRLFSLVFHNSTYTFGAVTAIFLTSLATGAALAGRVHRRIDRALAMAALVGAILVLSSIWIFVELTDLKYFSFGDSFVVYIAGALALVGIVVGPPITVLGMALPLIWRATQEDLSGTVVGRLTAANSLAAGAGVITVNFVLLPTIGLWTSLVVMTLLFLTMGIALLVRESRSLRTMAATSIAIVVTAVLIVLSPITSSLDRTQAGEELVKRWDSSYGFIDIVRTVPAGTFKVRQNLHYRFGETVGSGRESRQAIIPLLLHKRPRETLFLGLGMGLTAGAAVPQLEVERIVAVELIAEVVEAARELKDFNHNVVEDPKVEVVVDDARHYLLATERSFDVIVSDLFVPWESESGYLFTVEHYRAARRRLKPGGLFCQWVPLYQVGPREFEMIADSFRKVFPNVGVWWGATSSGKPVIALMGTEEAIVIKPAAFEIRMDELRKRAAAIDDELATPEIFLDHYEGDWPYRPGRRLNTDEHPRIEFSAPISNRDRKLLHGAALLEYYEETLSRLPAAAIYSHASADLDVTTMRRRAWRRIILSGAAL